MNYKTSLTSYGFPYIYVLVLCCYVYALTNIYFLFFMLMKLYLLYVIIFRTVVLIFSIFFLLIVNYFCKPKSRACQWTLKVYMLGNCDLFNASISKILFCDGNIIYYYRSNTHHERELLVLDFIFRAGFEMPWKPWSFWVYLRIRTNRDFVTIIVKYFALNVVCSSYITDFIIFEGQLGM